MNRLATIDELLSAVLRHIVLLAVVVAIGIAASLFYALSLPREYETTALIQIEQPQVQQSLGAAPNSQTLQQLQIIEQRVMSRGNLLTIVDQENLFGELPDMSESDKVHALRESAQVTRVSDPTLAWRPDITPTALSITVRLGDPELAARVANTLVSNVLEESRQSRSQRAEETLAFFESEEARLSIEIDGLEGELADFKRNNLNSLTGGLAAQREQLALLEQEKLELERELLELNAGNRGARNNIFISRVEQLEQQRDLLAERINVILELERRAPDVERELSRQERELQKLTDQYQVITRNQAEAEMGLMLQASQQGESFRVLEPAIPPEQPIAPNRKRIAFMGCVLSGFLGILLVAILELRNPIIRTENQLERQLGLRAVAVIPNVQVAHEKVWRKLTWVVGITVFVLAVLVIVALVTGR